MSFVDDILRKKAEAEAEYNHVFSQMFADMFSAVLRRGTRMSDLEEMKDELKFLIQVVDFFEDNIHQKGEQGLTKESDQ